MIFMMFLYLYAWNTKIIYISIEVKCVENVHYVTRL